MTLESRYHDRCQRLAGELRVLLGAPRARFSRMLEDYGAVDATRRLIHRRDPSSTFTLLWEKQRLDLTVEAVIVTEHEWDPLFEDTDRDSARQRLKDFRWPTAPGAAP